MSLGRFQAPILPGLIAQGDWQVQHLTGTDTTDDVGGACNKVDKVIQLSPTVVSQYQRFVRMHEYGHARWSPSYAYVPRVGGVYVQIAEDCRINSLLVKECGVAMPELPQRSVARLLSALDTHPSETAFAACLMGVAHLHSGYETHDLLSKAGGPELYRATQDLAKEAMRSRRKRMSYRTTVRLAKELQDLLSFLIPESESRAKKLLKLMGVSFLEQLKRKEDPKPIRKLLSQGKSPPIDSLIPSGLLPEPSADASCGWGPMEVVMNPMPNRTCSKSKVRRRRKTDMGLVLKHPHRMLTDKLCFETKKRLDDIGGTILIDGSGSMNLSSWDVERILKEKPLATIACYSSTSFMGTLSILAHDGRMVDPDRLAEFLPPGCYNIVDGPALDWLLQRNGRKYFITDCGFTGYEDVTKSHRYIGEMVRTAKQVGVVFCDDPSDYISGRFRGTYAAKFLEQDA